MLFKVKLKLNFNRNLYKAALYFKENHEDYLSLLICSSNETKLESALKSFQTLMMQTGDFYPSHQKSNKLECFQALKKKDRAKRVQEIFQKHKQILQQANLLCNLYVKNLNPKISESQIKQTFEKFGTLKSFKIHKRMELDRFSIFKSEAWVICFVSYAEEDSAKKAKKELNDSVYYAKPGLKLFVDYFESKKQREFTLKAKRKHLCQFANFQSGKNESSDNDAKLADDRRLLNFSRKRDFNPFAVSRVNYAEKETCVNKNKEEINLKNRLDFVVGNDFDFVFAKFRKVFGIEINGQTAQQADKPISHKADFMYSSGLNIEKSLKPESTMLKKPNSYVTGKRPLMRSINKCLLERNKFDLGKENIVDNGAEETNKSENYSCIPNQTLHNFSLKINAHPCLTAGYSNPNLPPNYNGSSSFSVRYPFGSPIIAPHSILNGQQVPTANLINNSSFSENSGKANMLIKQDPHLNNLAPLMMTFDKNFFTASSGKQTKNLPVRPQNPPSSGLKHPLYQLEAKFQANHIGLLFSEKLNSFNCFAALKNLFPKIMEKVLIMEPESLQKMYLDDNYFISQVELIINLILRSEKL